VLAVAVAAAGAQFAEFSAEAGSRELGQERDPAGVPSAWLLPACAAVAAVALIATYHNVWVAVAAAVLTLASALVALFARDLFE
ncbi:hypothetical protein, partial [Pseudomonas sp. GP01-A4]|uniref:hypothetical protein n=1 Tax=Pseudomonas sp. GP01-A4 TaxID=2070571 RepID=UPI000CBC3378